MSFPLGAEVLIPARVVGLYGAGRAPEFQQVSLQLADGQGVITHPDNCRLAPEPAPEPALKAADPVEDKAMRPAHNKAHRPRKTKAAEVNDVR